MDNDRISRLTERQCLSLRLVYAHMSSKEIARHLGIEPGSVDQHIKSAMRILGVSNRREAAKMLADSEKDSRGVSETPADSIGMSAPTPFRGSLLPLSINGSRPTDIGWTKRLGWIAAITVGAALSFGALAAVAEAFTRLMRH
jgi:DNA-binding CsgD family transcriptional regulator